MLVIYKIARSNIVKLTPYLSARKLGGTGDIWLNANESPNGLDSKMIHKNLNRYPEPQPKQIILNYARYSKIRKNQILITRGADEGIDLIIKTFCELGGKDSIISCPPTYDMYGISAQIYDVENRIIPMLPDGQLNLKKIQHYLKTSKIIFICRPNNPTGHVINKSSIIDIIHYAVDKALIVIDEAYIEFCMQDSLASLIEMYPNLVILRTLSKAFGLAGLRCGFILANEVIINLLHKVIAPYPISTPVSDIANEALHHTNIIKMQNIVSKINFSRNYLYSELKKIDFVQHVFPSHANFILIRVLKVQQVFQYLSQKGIIIRNQSDKVNLQGCLRISIGSQKECLQLISVLKKFSRILK